MNKEEIEQLEQMVNQVESAIPLLREHIAKMKETELGEDNIMNRPVMEVLLNDSYLKKRSLALNRILTFEEFKHGCMTTVGEFVRVSKNDIIKYRDIGWRTINKIQDVLMQNGIYW